MNMKPQIRSAYIAGLSPLSLLIEHRTGSHPKHLPDAAPEQAPTDLSRARWRRPRALLLVLGLGLAMGAWQLLARADETHAVEASAPVYAPLISAVCA